MKKLFKTLVCLTLALVMCFGLTACGEFDGNFKTVASADEINTTFAKVKTEESDTETGYQLKATFKGAFENELGKGDIDMALNGKVSIKDGVKSAIESTMTFPALTLWEHTNRLWTPMCTQGTEPCIRIPLLS